MNKGTIVYLDQMRPDDPTAKCACGNGSFRKRDEDGAWLCTACESVRTTVDAIAALAAAKIPDLVYRCKCGSVAWRVGMGGLICVACDDMVGFDALFAKKVAP